MAGSEFETIDRLDDYWDAVVRRDEADLRGLDPALAETVQQLHALDDAPVPDPAFGQQLWQELMEDGTASGQPNGLETAAVRWKPVRRPRVTLGRWPLAGVAAAILATLVAGIYFVALRPAPVSAEEIVRKAQEVAASPAAGGIKSFVSVEKTVSRPGNPRMNGYAGLTGDEEIRSETKRWYEAPNRWRIEGSGTTVDAQGKEMPNRDWRGMAVSDGRDIWNYNAKANTVTVHQLDESYLGKDGSPAQSPLGQTAVNLQAVLQLSNPNVRPKLQGEETVAGRKAYVLAFPTGTPSASAPEMNGPRTVWVDEESYFVLKVVQISGTDGKWLETMEVTSVQYNVAVDPALFNFAPPTGAKVDDQRPKPAPTKGQFQQQMESMARQADFPVFLPSRLPGGLVPRQPRVDDMLGLQVEFAPPSEADGTSLATMTVRQQRATYDLVSRWTQSAESAAIGDAKGWLRRGFRNVDGTGGDSAAMVLRDGTLVSVSSFTLSPEDLVNVAASLGPVPGGHAPLPNPAPPSLDEIRRQASFKLFLPEYVPAGLEPEPPVAGSNQASDRVDALNVTYHSGDGAVALKLAEGPPRDPSGIARPMLTAPEVAIKEGITGRLYDYKTPTLQVRLLWWMQDGTFIGLETQVLSREELLKMAASMSPTADLGQTVLPPGRPTPTPVPAPTFTALRPAWLPERMTSREQYQPDPTGKGTEVVIGFDPRPEDQKPHGLLMLTEMSYAAAPGGGEPDPEETHETIGGRDVRVISRGENWITLTWTQGDVALTLTNPYDPPGHPRYTPDQLRRIVESIR